MTSILNMLGSLTTLSESFRPSAFMENSCTYMVRSCPCLENCLGLAQNPLGELCKTETRIDKVIKG